MGLDIVEVILDVEEAFGIKMPRNFDWVKMDTVGEWCDIIEDILARKDNNQDLVNNIFERLRETLPSVVEVNAEQIQSDKPLKDILPLAGRRRAWNRLEKSLKLGLPELHRPPAIKYSLILLSLALGCVCVFGVAGEWNWRQTVAVTLSLGVWGASLFIAALWGIILYWATIPTALDWGQDIQTVGDLTRGIAEMNFGAPDKSDKQWSSEEVWSKLQSIVVEVLDVKPSEVTREASFVEDLGGG